MKLPPSPALCAVLLLHGLPALSGFADVLYTTDFETFSAGSDQITGTEGWIGSPTGSHFGLGLTGIDPETGHGVIGLGNAAYIGGNDAALPASVTNSVVNVRRPVNFDPVAQNKEVVSIHCLLGIKDSTTTVGGIVQRDDFEVAILNTAGTIMGSVFFDNTTLDATLTPAEPKRTLFRGAYNGTSTLAYTATSSVFIDEFIHALAIRINYRTSKWSAWLDGVPVFSDAAFYAPSANRNLGAVAFRAFLGVTPSDRYPGNNYLLFDGLGIEAEPLPTPRITQLIRAPNGEVSLAWDVESGYRYQVRWSPDLTNWSASLPNSLITAGSTGTSSVFTDTTAPGNPTRFYQIIRMHP